MRVHSLQITLPITSNSVKLKYRMVIRSDKVKSSNRRCSTSNLSLSHKLSLKDSHTRSGPLLRSDWTSRWRRWMRATSSMRTWPKLRVWSTGSNQSTPRTRWLSHSNANQRWRDTRRTLSLSMRGQSSARRVVMGLGWARFKATIRIIRIDLWPVE